MTKLDLLIRKLSFLKRLLNENAVGIGSIAVKSLMDDPESICLVKECRSLEGDYGTSYTDKLLTNADEVVLREMKNDIRKRDKARLVRKCTTKAPLIVEVNRRGGHWRAIWDSVLQCGSIHTTGLQFLTRILAHHGHGSKPCPLCEDLLYTWSRTGCTYPSGTLKCTQSPPIDISRQPTFTDCRPRH